MDTNKKNELKTLFITNLFGILTVLVLWHLIALIVNRNFLPYPVEVIMNFFHNLDTLVIHSMYSMYRLSVAVILALLIGITLGIILGTSQLFDKLISPAVYVLYPIPKSAFLPIFILFFDLGDKPKIILIFSIIILQIVLTTRDAVKSIDRIYFKAGKLIGLNHLHVLIHIIFPAITPKVITTLRISLGTGIAVLFFSENFATSEGIGYYIMNSWSLLNYLNMYTGIFTLSVIGYILFKLLDALELVLCRWR